MAEPLIPPPAPTSLEEDFADMPMLDDAPTQDSSTDSDDDSVKADPAKADAAVLKAVGLKDAGNAFLKEGEKSYDKAVRSYRRGMTALKGLNEKNTGDEQVKSLLISLGNNMCMVLAKQSKFLEVIKVSKQVTDIDAVNLKAMYRTGMAQRSTGNLDKARTTLKRALELHPDSRECKLELANVKKSMDDAKKKEKALFGGTFDKGGLGNLYQDKEEENRLKKIKKIEDGKKEKLRKEEEAKKLKQQWEDECVARMARSEPPISEDEWMKEKEDEKKKKGEKKEKEKKRRAEKAVKKKHEVVKVDGDSSDEDIGTVRGYKLNKDGKKTSFFNNDMTDEQKALIGDIAPKAIDSTPQPIAAVARKASDGASSWNKAGTWEEKDTSEWCKQTLETALSKVEVEANSLTSKVAKVDDMAGDASVVVIRAKKRYVFDLSCSLNFEIHNDEEDKVGKGKMKLLEISSTAADEGEWEVELEWKKGGSDAKVKAACGQLVEAVKGQLTSWVADFNAQY